MGYLHGLKQHCRQTPKNDPGSAEVEGGKTGFYPPGPPTPASPMSSRGRLFDTATGMGSGPVSPTSAKEGSGVGNEVVGPQMQMTPLPTETAETDDDDVPDDDPLKMLISKVTGKTAGSGGRGGLDRGKAGEDEAGGKGSGGLRATPPLTVPKGSWGLRATPPWR